MESTIIGHDYNVWTINQGTELRIANVLSLMWNSYPFSPYLFVYARLNSCVCACFNAKMCLFAF